MQELLATKANNKNRGIEDKDNPKPKKKKRNKFIDKVADSVRAAKEDD